MQIMLRRFKSKIRSFRAAIERIAPLRTIFLSADPPASDYKVSLGRFFSDVRKNSLPVEYCPFWTTGCAIMVHCGVFRSENSDENLSCAVSILGDSTNCRTISLSTFRDSYICYGTTLVHSSGPGIFILSVSMGPDTFACPISWVCTFYLSTLPGTEFIRKKYRKVYCTL